MTLQQLEYIKAVDEYRHFGNAAEACGITQPTLSLMIKKLEEELDVVIFDRDAHPIKATEAGRKIIDKAGIVLYNARQLAEMTKSQKQLCSGPIRIAMISTVSPVIIPGLFSYLHTKHPTVEPLMQEMLSTTIVDKLKRAEIDMGIVRSPISDPSLLEIPLYHEKFFAYVSPDNPLYIKDKLESAKLLDHPVWIIKDGIREFDRTMLGKGESFHYDTMYEGGRVGNIIAIVNQVGGMTIIPELHAELMTPAMRANLRPIVNPEEKRTISLVIRKDYIHEEKLNIIIDGIRKTVPPVNQEEVIRKGRLHI